MQSVDYVINLSGNFSTNINSISEATQKFANNVETAKKGVSGLTAALAGVNIFNDAAQKINNVFSGITQAGAQAELQLQNLRTLFGGNAQAAEEMYQKISQYGKETPYNKAGLIEAQRTMMSFGIEGEKAFSVLKQIGDIAMGDAGKMSSLSLAFAQMSSAGKLTGQDLMQMINAGFNPLNEISKLTGKSIAELKDEMSKGKISVSMVEAAFASATSEGGLFFGAIEKASETTAGKMASFQDSVDEIKVSIFNATGDVGLWVSSLTQCLVPVSSLIPLIGGLGKGMTFVKNIQWASMWSAVRGGLYAGRLQMLLMNKELATGQFASNGFLINITRATLGVVRFATVGLLSGLKALGAYLLSLITTGTASKAFSATASTAFGAFKLSAVSACRAIGTAIMNIPLIGWIAAAIAALVAIGVYFWNTSATFRATLKGLWAGFKATFTGIGDLARTVFGGIGDLIKAAFRLDGDGIQKALEKMKGGFSDFGGEVSKAFNGAYAEEIERSKKEKEAKDKAEQTADVAVPPVPAMNIDPTAGSLSSPKKQATSAGEKIKNVTVNVNKLVEKFEIRTTNLNNDLSQVKNMVSEALLSALNDVNLAM